MEIPTTESVCHRNKVPSRLLHVPPRVNHDWSGTDIDRSAATFALRFVLENSYGLKRWEVGEIASKIGQLYYHY
jgi:hypothetical protein